MLYHQHMDGAVHVREILSALDELDARVSDKQMFEVTVDGWRSAA